MCATHGPCHYNWTTLFRLAAEAPGCAALESTFAPSLILAGNYGCTNGFGIREKWPLPSISLPFLTAQKPNVAVLAIPLFGTEVGRSADKRSWPNAQRKPLNAAKNTERLRIRSGTKNTEHGYSGLAPLYMGCSSLSNRTVFHYSIIVI